MDPTPASAAPHVGSTRWSVAAGGVAPGSVTRAASASPQRSCHCLARLMREALGFDRFQELRRRWQMEKRVRFLSAMALLTAVAVLASCSSNPSGPDNGSQPESTLWRLVMTWVPDAPGGEPGNYRHIIRMERSSSSFTIQDRCASIPSPITVTQADTTISWVGGEGEVYTGTLRDSTMDGVVSQGSQQIGTWSATLMPTAEFGAHSCVEWSADVFSALVLPDTDTYVLVAQLYDPNGTVQSATVSGDVIGGPYALSEVPDRLSEVTHSTDLADPGLILSEGSEPNYPLYYTVHIEFADEASSDRDRAVTQWWYIDEEDQ